MKEKHYKKILQNDLVKISIFVLLILSILYNGLEYWELKKENLAINTKNEELINNLLIISDKLHESNKEKADIAKDLEVEKANGEIFQSQIQNIAITVGALDKLSKTDEELLQKYSKVYFLNENYIPQNLSTIDSKYLYDKDKLSQIHTNVLPHLERLLETASSSQIDLKIISAYRSFGTQESLKSSYKFTYGAGTANKFSADQGYSEHQLGTTVDFTTKSVGASFVGFEKTPSYKWLQENAHKFGFVLSYPENNGYYAFEPWHFRFVGIQLATKLYDEKKYFYELDPREIANYLANLFD